MDATVYGPLCGFTCSHGYCPEGACATNPYGSTDGATPGTVGIKPLPCTSLAPSATFTLSAACTDGILNLPTSGPEASVNNIPAGSPAVCNEVCDFFRLLTGTCCGQGGNTTNTVEIVPSLVIPLDIPLPSGFVPNVPIIVPVPGKYDPDEVFGNPTSTPTTTTSSSTTLAAIITTTFTTTYTSYSTFPVTQIDQNGQITTTTSSTPVVATSTGTTTTTSSGSKVTGSTDDNSGSNNDDDHTRKPRKTCRTIGAGTPLITFLAHVPLPSSITLPAGMCLPGSDPLRIPPIPLPNTDPPCYKKDCSPCQKGACGGDRSSSGSSTGSTSPTDPTEPEQCAAGGSDAPSSERGTCGNGNFPLWDSATGQITCDLPASEAQDQMSDCQADAMDDIDDTLDEIDCYADDCGQGSLAKRGKKACPIPQAYKPSQNAACDAVFDCDVDRWPNVCNNVRSAIDKKNAPSILTHYGKSFHATSRWLLAHGLDQNVGGAERNEARITEDPNKATKRAGWGLIGCEVEEYPFGNSRISDRAEANYYERPTLRLIPEKENNDHGIEMGKFINYVKKLTNQKKNPTYCVEVSSSSGQTLPADYCISEWQSCNNKCAQAYGPSFILVNRATDGDANAARRAGYTNMQEWDLWFDDPSHSNRKWEHTLSWDPVGLAQIPPVYRPVTSTMPPQFPPSYIEKKVPQPPGPGQKIYVGNFPFGSWELSFVDKNGVIRTVGTPKAVVPKADGSHLIYDADPGQGYHFPYYRRKRDLTMDDTAEGEYPPEEALAQNASMSTEESHLPGLSRRASVTGTSFLDSRVYTEVLSCPLDSELEPCTDCALQGGVAPIPDGAGSPESTAVSTGTTSHTSTTSTTTAATSLPTIPPDTKPLCFRTIPDDHHQSFTVDEYELARVGLCASQTLHVDDSPHIWTHPNTNLVASTAWTADQTGCNPRADFLMTKTCETWMDEILQDCDEPIANVDYFGGSFVYSGENGCVTFYLGKQLLIS